VKVLWWERRQKQSGRWFDAGMAILGFSVVSEEDEGLSCRNDGLGDRSHKSRRRLDRQWFLVHMLLHMTLSCRDLLFKIAPAFLLFWRLHIANIPRDDSIAWAKRGGRMRTIKRRGLNKRLASEADL
jgi:hypothetical protein